MNTIAKTDFDALGYRVRPEIAKLPDSGIVEVWKMGFTVPDVIGLWVGEGDLPTTRFICDAAAKALNEGHTFYTYKRGIPELRQALIDQLKGHDLREQIEMVNQAMNRHPYITTMQNWHRSMYWETAFEFLRYGGQCQDYAIAKYLLLRSAGVSNEALCPACRAAREQLPRGILLLRGSFWPAHRDEILSLIEHESASAAEKNPLERVIATHESPDTLVIETTNEKLAQRLGRRLESAYDGTLEEHFDAEGYFVRVNWHRDA